MAYSRTIRTKGQAAWDTREHCGSVARAALAGSNPINHPLDSGLHYQAVVDHCLTGNDVRPSPVAAPAGATLPDPSVGPFATTRQPDVVFGETYACSSPQSVSILINNFNYQSFVGAAIESALGQTQPAQIIVVDDGSSDESREVISRFADRTHVVFKPNGGQASAMNEAFALATGDLVVFLDSDDLLAPNLVETLLTRWRPGTVLAQYPLSIIDASGASRGVYPDPPEIGLADGDVRPQLLTTGGFAVNVTSGLVFARRALEQVMPIPQRPFRNGADGYLTRAVAFLGPVQRIDTRLGSYRQHGRNDSDVCAVSAGLADGFRKKIRYAETEFFTTRTFAGKHGYSTPTDLGERDAQYIGYRLFSLLLEPQRHPIRSDRRWPLLRRYVQARWHSRWRTHRKLLALSLTGVATLAPTRLSSTLIRWLHDSTSRPSWLRMLTPKRG